MTGQIRDEYKAIDPPWLTEGVAEKYQYAMGLVQDACLESVVQAVKAHLPGAGTPTALMQIGADRLIPQGIAESNASYAARLRLAFPSWRRAGIPGAICRQFEPTPTNSGGVVTHVDGASNWCDLLSNGTERYYSTASSVPWVWNSLSNPWYQAWIIFRPQSDGTPAFANGPRWGDGFKFGDGTKWGLSFAGSGAALRSLFLQIASQWLPAHEACVGVIVAFNFTDFSPLGDMPDATFHKDYKIVAGCAVPSRFSTSRYIMF